MAFDFFQNQEDEDQQQGGEKQLGTESPIVTGTTQQQPGVGGEKKSASGSFTNLNAYLDANKSRQFGQQVAGRVQGEVDAATQAQKEAEEGFKGDVDKSTVKLDSSLYSTEPKRELQGVKTESGPVKPVRELDPGYQMWSGPVSPVRGGSFESLINPYPSQEGFKQGVIQNAQSIASDPTKLASFQKMRDAQYGGPNALVDTGYYEPAYAKTNYASTAGSVGEDAGRKAYIKDRYATELGRYDYTPGQQTLDNLLIQLDPGAREALGQAGSNAQAASQKFTDLNQMLDAYAKQGKQTTADTRSTARGAIGIDESGNITQDSPILAYQKVAQDRAAALNAQKAAEAQRLKSELDSRIISAADMQKLGLQRGQQVYGLDLKNYLNTAPDVDYNRAATPWEQQQVSSLSKLGDLENSYLPYADLAGKYDTGQFNTFNLNNLQQQAATKRAAYMDEYGTPNPITNFGGGVANPNVIEPNQSLKDAIAASIQRQKQAEQGYKDTGTWDNNAFTEISQYQKMLQALADLQKRYGYGDTIGGGMADDDWRRLKNYQGARPQDYGDYRPGIASTVLPGIRY